MEGTRTQNNDQQPWALSSGAYYLMQGLMEKRRKNSDVYPQIHGTVRLKAGAAIDKTPLTQSQTIRFHKEKKQ